MNQASNGDASASDQGQSPDIAGHEAIRTHLQLALERIDAVGCAPDVGARCEELISQLGKRALDNI